MFPTGADRRESIVRFIADFHSKNGYAPSFREIGEGVGLASTATVKLHVAQLVRDGRLTQAAGQARSVIVTVGT